MSGSEKRAQAKAKRCAMLRRNGLTIGQIAELVCLDRDKVNARVILGERLLSLEESK